MFEEAKQATKYLFTIFVDIKGRETINTLGITQRSVNVISCSAVYMANNHTLVI